MQSTRLELVIRQLLGVITLVAGITDTKLRMPATLMITVLLHRKTAKMIANRMMIAALAKTIKTNPVISMMIPVILRGGRPRSLSHSATGGSIVRRVRVR